MDAGKHAHGLLDSCGVKGETARQRSSVGVCRPRVLQGNRDRLQGDGLHLRQGGRSCLQAIDRDSRQRVERDGAANQGGLSAVYTVGNCPWPTVTAQHSRVSPVGSECLHYGELDLNGTGIVGQGGRRLVRAGIGDREQASRGLPSQEANRHRHDCCRIIDNGWRALGRIQEFHDQRNSIPLVKGGQRRGGRVRRAPD